MLFRSEYQAMLVDSLKDQVSGGQGLDTRITCITNGMPRMMTFIRPVEFIVLPAVTYPFRKCHAAPHLYRRSRNAEG